MAATSLLIKTTDTSNKAQQKSIPYINPAATDAALKTFAQKLVAMSTDYYDSTTRVDTKNLDTESGGSVSAKTEPTLTVGSWGANSYQGISGVQAPVTYNGDGTLGVSTSIPSAVYTNSGATYLFIGQSSGSFTGTLYATEGTNYAAKSISFSK